VEEVVFGVEYVVLDWANSPVVEIVPFRPSGSVFRIVCKVENDVKAIE